LRSGVLVHGAAIFRTPNTPVAPRRKLNKVDKGVTEIAFNPDVSGFRSAFLEKRQSLL
jgi:hypothetical protein